MSGMEFAWRLISVLVWPAVILALLLVFRRSLVKTAADAMADMRIRKLTLPGGFAVELEQASRDVVGVLSETAKPPTAEDPIPTNLVDLYPMAAANPRRGIHAGLRQVRRALEELFPQLVGLPLDRLPAALRELVRNGELHPEVESAVGRLVEAVRLVDVDGAPVAVSDAYQFLSVAEGAIHAILRSARLAPDPPPAGAGGLPIAHSWQGLYNGNLGFELEFEGWGGDTFTGAMRYPGSGTTTDITGRVISVTPSGAEIEWRETGYRAQGHGNVDLNGEYRAKVVGRRMTGAWWQGDRQVASFEMTAAG